jgi:hypothetical protein
MADERADQMGDLHLLSLEWSLADKEHPAVPLKHRESLPMATK